MLDGKARQAKWLDLVCVQACTPLPRQQRTANGTCRPLQGWVASQASLLLYLFIISLLLLQVIGEPTRRTANPGQPWKHHKLWTDLIWAAVVHPGLQSMTASFVRP